MQRLGRKRIGIYSDMTELAERAQVVKPTHMVEMDMCKKYSVYASEIIQPQHLLAKVGSAVN